VIPLPPNRLRLDGAALAANWRLLAAMSGAAACGAAVKADGYGLGAREVVRRLAAAGARDFYVATWHEAAALADLGASVSVLHGVRAEDMPAALANNHARPVLNTAAQVARWRDGGGGVCDVMVDTGMNRLGVSGAEVGAGLLDGLAIDTLMSHLACADEDSAMNEEQRARLAAVAARTAARRISLANSAGIALGAAYHFDLTRPGLALYGGVPRATLGGVRQVVHPEAQVLQRRRVAAGETVGYNATWRATEDGEVAIVNLGYADGYPLSLSNYGSALGGGQTLPVIGRVSMDLVALEVSGADVGEGDWVTLDYALPDLAARSGRSQYELLTGLGQRFERVWHD
jgi:alanine racemase